ERQRLPRDRLQPNGYFGDDAEGPLAAGEQPDEVVSGDAFDGAASGAQDLAIGEHDLQGQDVLGGDAVLDAAHAAGVGRDISTYCGRFVGARVWRVPQTVR